MNYAATKKLIKSGDIILWSGKGLAARFVQWATKSAWSHIGIAVWWSASEPPTGHQSDRLMVLDSYPFKGTRARLLSHDLKNAFWMPSGSNWNRKAQGFALDELDRRYSFQNLWKTWLGLDLVSKEYHCAQYVAAVLSRAGL
ncbi:MAG: hypothetical protein FWG12_08000, partial [Holophagaceae bacterium]|nr:hypothetical protein [Holophagaceae bacterium]